MSATVGWVAPTAAVLVVAIASVAAVDVVSGRSPATLGRPIVATSTPAERVDFSDEREVDVTFDRSQPQPLSAGRGGTVTETWCAPGRPLVSGTKVLRLDDAVVYGLHQSIPLYRGLKTGDRGLDVKALQRELVRLGKDVDVNGRFGPATRRALRSVEKSAGLAKPDGVLDLAEVVWLPSSQVRPATCELGVGERATSGAPVATLPPTLTAVRTGAPPQGTLPGARSLTLFGQRTQLVAGAPTTDPRFLAAVSGSPEYAEALEAKDADRPRATLALEKPVTAYKVPPGAVFALTGDQGCVESGDRAVPVVIVGSGLGASLVTSTVPLGQVDVGSAITATQCSPS